MSIKRSLPILLLLLTPALALASSESEIRQALESKYTLTQRSKWSAEVTKPGTVLVVQKSGLQANTPRLTMKPTVIKNGQLEYVGGGSFMGGDSGHTLKVGEKMYLYAIQTNPEAVTLIYGTVESYERMEKGSTKVQPYQLALRFEYDGGLQAVDTERVVKDVSSYFTTESEAASSNVNTVKLGQTPEEVVAILGVPDKKVDLGKKLIYTYKDMKIVFIDGKVADVE
jgi:hypothetical protein